MQAKCLQKDEDGHILILVLLLLLLITIMGTASITMSTFEVQISDNEKRYQNDFYAADSGWMQGVLWLEDQSSPPSTVNTTSDNIVRNYGDGGQNVLNSDFADGTQDGTINNVPYWYKMTNLPDESNKTVSGFGPNYRSFTYTATCNANGTQAIEVKLTKVFRVGY
jgi:Tfp pilus assembly protein PilX